MECERCGVSRGNAEWPEPDICPDCFPLLCPHGKDFDDCAACDEQGRTAYRCPHGNPPEACDPCFYAGDLAYDADREDRYFGR